MLKTPSDDKSREQGSNQVNLSSQAKSPAPRANSAASNTSHISGQQARRASVFAGTSQFSNSPHLPAYGSGRPRASVLSNLVSNLGGSQLSAAMQPGRLRASVVYELQQASQHASTPSQTQSVTASNIDALIATTKFVFDIEILKQLQENIQKLIAQAPEACKTLTWPDTLYVNETIISTAYADCIKQIQKLIDRITAGETIDGPYGDYIKRPLEAKNKLDDPRRTYSFFILKSPVTGQVEMPIFLDLKSKTARNEPVMIDSRRGGFTKWRPGPRISDPSFVPWACSAPKRKEVKEDAATTEPKQDDSAPKTEGTNVAIFSTYQNMLAFQFQHLHYFQPEFVIDVGVIPGKDPGIRHRYTPFAHCDLQEALDSNIFSATFQPQDGLDFDLDRTVVEYNGFKIPKCVLDVILQIADIMRILAAKGISHNDIKPDNLLCTFVPISDTDPVKWRIQISIIDFDPKITKTYDESEIGVRGTPIYFPPESTLWILARLNDFSPEAETKIADTIEFLRTKHREALGLSLSEVAEEDIQPYLGANAVRDTLGYLYEIVASDKDKVPKDNTEAKEVYAKWLAQEKLFAEKFKKGNYGGKHDLWSAGVTFEETLLRFVRSSDPTVTNLDHATFLHAIENTPIRKLFAFNPDDRGTADELFNNFFRFVEKLLAGKPQAECETIDKNDTREIPYGTGVDNLFAPSSSSLLEQPRPPMLFSPARSAETPSEAKLQSILDELSIAPNLQAALEVVKQYLNAEADNETLIQYKIIDLIDNISLATSHEDASIKFAEFIKFDLHEKFGYQSANTPPGSPALTAKPKKFFGEVLLTARQLDLSKSLVELALKIHMSDIVGLRDIDVIISECVNRYQESNNVKKEIQEPPSGSLPTSPGNRRSYSRKQGPINS
jgi:serine/threonine protein kinase